jgi:hypothetical protein
LRRIPIDTGLGTKTGAIKNEEIKHDEQYLD